MIKEDDVVALSTYDNPYSPFGDSFVLWWKYDHALEHNTCELLSREACVNDLASDEVNDLYTREAMERIVKNNPTMYRIVRPSDYKMRSAVTVGGS